MSQDRVSLASIVGVLGGLSVPVLAVPGQPALVGVVESCLAGFADGLTSSLVFVVRRDVADALVQADAVVVLADNGQFGAQGGWVADREQVRVLGLEVAVEGLDTGWATRRGARVRVLFRVASLRTGLASFPAPGSPVIMSWS
jgi:hypothetical protein